MNHKVRLRSVRFRNFKAFRDYSMSLRSFNVMVGPNNCGKSTIIGAFKILSEGIRRAKARKPDYVDLPGGKTLAYPVELEGLPVSTENVFTDYDDSQSAVVLFGLSNNNRLKLVFPEISKCYLVCETRNKTVHTPSIFRKEYPISVGFVPVLGPVDHEEPLYHKEAARRALLSYGASRNFRNIWWHYPEDFQQFQELVRSTWPGMDIQRPESSVREKGSVLHMFCPEQRFPRELYWAGFGFQAWCQMLTYSVRCRNDSLFIIDEPDIYLHSDLQRQLVSVLRDLGPDILIATHSTEIIAEADPGELLTINKHLKSAKRIKSPAELQSIFSVLGSNLNPILTQLAKTKRAVFVEGKDFKILSAFARRLGKQQVANRTDFAVIPLEGFNLQKVKDFAHAMELTLGVRIEKGVILDRDYRSLEEIGKIKQELRRVCTLVHIHGRKEIENYLLEPTAIERALRSKLIDRSARGAHDADPQINVRCLLKELTERLRNDLQGQYLVKRQFYEKARNPGYDPATISSRLLSEFDQLWTNFSERIVIVPGKSVLSLLNKSLQDQYKVTLTVNVIVRAFETSDIQTEIKRLIDELERFRMGEKDDEGGSGGSL
jgi:AAA domain, putative AbiEii toxin, Type IV TA system